MNNKNETIVIVERKGVASAVFWGLFDFFIILPLLLLVTCSLCNGFIPVG